MSLETIEDLVKFDIRNEMFERAVHYVEYEMVEGDIVEFGVYTGRSLALLSYAYLKERRNSIHKFDYERNVHGFDSFEGVHGSEHPRWKEGIFSHNHSAHPFLEKGDKVNKEVVDELFRFYRLVPPLIWSGKFIAKEIHCSLDKVAIVHIDCDTAEASIEALQGISHRLQEGSILLFDDWFNFKGSANRGEQFAFKFFKERNPGLKLIEYFPYATFGKSFIVERKIYED